MKNACIIGNSHASSLKIALDRRYKPETVAIATYLIPGRAEPRLRLVNGVFRPEAGFHAVRTDLGDLTESGLDASRFDAILLSALGIMPPTDAFLDGGECPIGLAGLFGASEGGSPRNGTPPLVSRQFMEAMILERFQKTGGYRLLTDLSKTFSGTITVQRFPPPSLAILDMPDNGLVRRFGTRARDAFEAFSILRDKVLEAAIRAILPSVRMIEAPSAFLEGPGFLKPVFQRAHDDPWHTNDVYGEAVIRQFEAFID